MDKWLKDLSAWKDYGLIILAISIFRYIASNSSQMGSYWTLSTYERYNKNQ